MMRERLLEPQPENEVCCPKCGELLGVNSEIYTFRGSNTVVGCSECIGLHNAYEWFVDLNDTVYSDEYFYNDYDVQKDLKWMKFDG